MNCFYHPQKTAVGFCNFCMKALCKRCCRDTPFGLACSAHCEQQLRKNQEASTNLEDIASNYTTGLFSPAISYDFIAVFLFLAGLGMVITMFFIPVDVFLIIFSLIFFTLAGVSFWIGRLIKNTMK